MKCYCLKGKNGDYVARDPTNNIYLTSSIDKALFTETKNKAASIRLNNIPKTLKKFGPYEIIEITKIDGKIYIPSVSVESFSTNDMLNEVVDRIDTFSKQINKIDAYQSELNSIISYTDLELVDMLHYIEFHKFSACEGYKLCKKIQEICDRRREAKNKMQIIHTVKTQSCSSIISGNAINEMEKIMQKQYTPRVLEDLFKVNENKIRQEKLNENN